MAKLGGLKPTIKALGNAVLPGFTASKILWLKKHEPKNYRAPGDRVVAARLSEFLAHRRKTMEYGDASGTALLDVRKREWSDAVIDAIDPELAGKLPLADRAATSPRARYRPPRPSCST